jgi:hypothetical protein
MEVEIEGLPRATSSIWDFFATFTTTLCTCTSPGVHVDHLEWGPECELRSKADIEKSTGSKPKELLCHVKVLPGRRRNTGGMMSLPIA